MGLGQPKGQGDYGEKHLASSELWTIGREANHFLEPDFTIKASDSLRFILLAHSPTQWEHLTLYP